MLAGRGTRHILRTKPPQATKLIKTPSFLKFFFNLKTIKCRHETHTVATALQTFIPCHSQTIDENGTTVLH